ncbi:meiosis-specific nuclear structural protein 1-like [Palaemon carinicauda]|uniref:meiosis-specific nuclear structural protein 1-like n=1 Tax=Palaemon carinicauda TaxID=392227 RepID=UPI0035B655C2
MERKLAEANLKIESLEKELRNRRSVEEAMNTNRLRKSRDEILLLKEKIISNARHQRKEALERLALEKQITELDQVIQQQVRQFHAEKEVLQKTIRETKLAFDSTRRKLSKEREMLQMYKEVLFLRESLLGAKKRISFLEKALEDERRRNVSLQVELEIKGKVVNQLEDEASELRKEVRWKDKQLFSMAKTNPRE